MQTQPTIIYCDSSSAIKLSRKPFMHKKKLTYWCIFPLSKRSCQKWNYWTTTLLYRGTNRWYHE